MRLRFTFLGTGTSQGVPMVACPCEVCHSTDPRDKRMRTSALLQVGEVVGFSAKARAERLRAVGALNRGEEYVEDPAKNGHDGKNSEECKGLNIVIDAGPDFRTQMLAAGVTKLDAILLTHEHKDHTGGIDDVRAFNFFQKAPVDIWATERVQKAVHKDYDYVFAEMKYPGAPEITLRTIGDEPFTVNGVGDMSDRGIEVVPVKGTHMNIPVTGFRVGNFAYLTDFNKIEDSEVEKLKGVDTLVVNAIGHAPHISHFNLEQAIELGRRVGARRTYITHIAHRMGRHADLQPVLPEGVFLAYDGLTIDLA